MNSTVPTVATEHLGTILGVWAHPDDEAYLSAGLMAAATRAGQRVAVVTATAGELGTPDPVQWPPARLAKRRRREMVRSLAVVGVDEHYWLGRADGGCADVDHADAVADIGRIVEHVRPDTIVTFGPDGMTGHPDHRAVSSWTTTAWSVHRPGARLWYATVLPSFHARWGIVNDELGIFPPEGAPCTPDEDAVAVVTCDGWVLDAKVAALHAHASQTGPLIDRLGMDTFRRWWAVEAFADAARARVGSRR
jgi:LmbE family N-acetylglucosaminyl deacetylase